MKKALQTAAIMALLFCTAYLCACSSPLIDMQEPSAQATKQEEITEAEMKNDILFVKTISYNMENKSDSYQYVMDKNGNIKEFKTDVSEWGESLNQLVFNLGTRTDGKLITQLDRNQVQKQYNRLSSFGKNTNIVTKESTDDNIQSKNSYYGVYYHKDGSIQEVVLCTETGSFISNSQDKDVNQIGEWLKENFPVDKEVP